MQPQPLEHEDARRANAYHVLARCLDPPELWEAGLPDLIITHVGGLAADLEDAASRTASEMTAALDDREPVTIAHAKLFIGPFEILAPPYASMYLDAERRMMGPVSQEVAQIYAEAGLAPTSQVREAPDHVTHELEFLYWLGFQQESSGNVEWRSRQQRFWEEHLGRWLPAFAAAVIDADAHAYYVCLGRLMRDFCTHEHHYFSRGV